ncbi:MULTISPECIES: nickel-responsive transcriptional regulator NikR [Asticcacaulis]|uniref:nickel-responsive transcriptional regulator NikR n=1 Tax=Asticcacaulis TaxID=76890 RepID=UPI001AE18BE0|nr:MULTISPECIES: nickel-responsive transcriptional regulator NikR [Asticcacaulis]MBP2157459.1 CopG family nickel-responsive transcriptional regulator [Asticcacaulis solisilvae]MDR6798504.1 CopG family nickel-responsive transcriptional regulator [Asticcacaulis sp. BE141]
MQRVTISIDEELSAEYDQLIAEQGYQSKSEAIRDLVRQAVEARRANAPEGGFCVASLSYVYDHHTRALAQRLVELQHNHHDVVVATMHVHLDHDSCLETAILKGPTADVRALADRIQAERGVRFASNNLITVEPNGEHAHDHSHDHDHPHTHSHGHEGHFSPKRG